MKGSCDLAPHLLPLPAKPSNQPPPFIITAHAPLPLCTLRFELSNGLTSFSLFEVPRVERSDLTGLAEFWGPSRLLFRETRSSFVLSRHSTSALQRIASHLHVTAFTHIRRAGDSRHRSLNSDFYPSNERSSPPSLEEPGPVEGACLVSQSSGD
ncbi:hypothetical protein FALCPG4_017539 [Fusarium falciforme]